VAQDYVEPPNATRTVEEYSSLITQFHYHRPKFNAMVEDLASAPVQVGTTAAFLPEAFDLDSSVGVQLDVDGQWIGKTRYVPYPLDTYWFSLDIAALGFDLGVWKGPYDTDFGVYRLSDDMYRKLLYAKIDVNNWDGTRGRAEEILLGYYGNPALSPGSFFFLDDHGDTSSSFAVAGRIPPPLVLSLLAWPALPLKVGGYEMRYRVTSIDNAPLFGFDVDNDHVAGFDQGAFGVPPLAMIYREEIGTGTDFSNPNYSSLIPSMT
jgi:hypothetical protein